jgi:hypothetical protein
MDIKNKTRKPLNVPLPGGKRLFLGPGKTGQVSPKDLEHPALAKLLEAGDLETADGGPRHKDGATENAGGYAGTGRSGSSIKRQSGDR